ncbi:MAG: aminotransferase class IV, partial [Nitrospiria bacterium]
MWVYLQDRFVSKEEAKVSIFDHGFLYGDGLFETLRAYSGRIFALPQHLNRLAHAAERLQIPLPFLSSLETLLYETLRRNHLHDALLRLTVSRGEGEIALDPDLCTTATLVISARPFQGYASKYYAEGVKAVIVPIRRNPPASLDPALKSLSFLNNVLAKIEAKKRGVFEGIFLDLEGALSEGTTSNLFWVRDGKIKTPSAASILEGITRGVVIELAKKMGFPLEEGRYFPADLLAAEEAFLTNTGLELMPLAEVDGEAVELLDGLVVAAAVAADHDGGASRHGAWSLPSSVD